MILIYWPNQTQRYRIRRDHYVSRHYFLCRAFEIVVIYYFLNTEVILHFIHPFPFSIWSLSSKPYNTMLHHRICEPFNSKSNVNYKQLMTVCSNRRPKGLNGHLSIRDSTLTSCQSGSYFIFHIPLPHHRIIIDSGIGKQHYIPFTGRKPTFQFLRLSATFQWLTCAEWQAHFSDNSVNFNCRFSRL